jgi:hypothetical protein
MKRFLGMFVLLAAVGVVVGYKFLVHDPAATITVRGLVGSEKIAFLENPEVVRILQRNYGIMVEASKAGSVEMVREPAPDYDFLWPAGQVNVDMFQESGGKAHRVESVFHSPIVIYSWDLVADSFLQRKILARQGETYFLTNPLGLFDRVIKGETWKDVGLPQLFGKISITTTDPTKSNSGNMYAALLANMLNNGEVVTEDKLDVVLEKLKSVFQRQGHMEHSSGVLFGMFVEQGVGAYPLIVGYENQLIEFSVEHRESINQIRDKLRIIYPQPTVWASHPLIALTENGAKLLEALRDKRIQEIAWRSHGFRSGSVGGSNDTSVFEFGGLPNSITSVMPTPNARTMDRIIMELTR